MGELWNIRTTQAITEHHVPIVPAVMATRSMMMVMDTVMCVIPLISKP